MGAFDDTICQLRDLGMGKVANIIRDLERDNITLAGNNFKLREELTTLRQKIDSLEPVAWMANDGSAVHLSYWSDLDTPLFDLKGIK